MYIVRPILIAAVFVLYGAHVLGGRAIHLWQCSTCCAPVSSECRRSGSCACVFHNENEQGGDSQREGDDHDSSTCWICQVLGQAEEKPIDLEIAVSRDRGSVSLVRRSRIYTSASRASYQSRGPPAMHASLASF